MIISANSSKFLDPIYESLETSPVVINSCMSRSGGCENNTLVQNAFELDVLRKDKTYVWRPQNRLIAYKTPNILFSETIRIKELIEKNFSKGCLVGFGKRPISLIYMEEYADSEEGEQIDEADMPLLHHYVIDEIKWYTVKDSVAYVPLANGELVRGAY